MNAWNFRRRCSAIIDFRISVQKYPKKPEGDLSKLRAMIVREESLAGFASWLSSLISLSS